MKKIFITAGLVASAAAFAQTGKVGVNETAPAATLDIKPNAANLTGTTNEGILIPRLSVARVTAIAAPVEGTLVYVTDAPSTALFTDTTKGFYYYDSAAAKWTKMGAGASGASTNLYTADGTLTATRTVTQNNQNLTFTTGTARTIINGTQQNNGAMYVASGTNLRSDASTSGPTFTASDYMVILTNTALNGNLLLPSAAANSGRVIYLINGTTSGINFATGTADNTPFNYSTLPVKGSSGFVSTGSAWYTIGR